MKVRHLLATTTVTVALASLAGTSALAGNAGDQTPALHAQNDTSRQAELSEAEVHARLRDAGYETIEQTEYVRSGGEDYYRIRAYLDGTRYVLKVSDETGEILERGGRFPGGDRPNAPDRTIHDARLTLEDAGFYRIQGLRYTRRGGEDFFAGKAWRDDEGQFDVEVSDAQNGGITSQTMSQPASRSAADMEESELVRLMGDWGYDVRGYRYQVEGGTDYFLVRGDRAGVAYDLRVSDETGQILARAPATGAGSEQAGAQIDEREIHRRLNDQGYYRVHEVQLMQGGGDDYYVARAWKNDEGLYQLRVSDETGAVLERERLTVASSEQPEIDEVQIRAVLQPRAYKDIRIAYRQEGGTDFYVAEATRDGVRYVLRLSDETSEILERRELR